jgi:hypothetical protein
LAVECVLVIEGSVGHVGWRKREVGRGLVRFVRCDVMISTCAPAMDLFAWAVSLSRLLVLCLHDASIRAVLSKIPRNRMTSD